MFKVCILISELMIFNCLCIDMTRNKDDGKDRIFNESKTTYIECVPESEPFETYKIVFVHLLKNLYYYPYINRCFYTMLINHNYKQVELFIQV